MNAACMPLVRSFDGHAMLRRQGGLWSGLDEVCHLLGAAAPGSDAGPMFAHRRYKPGQHIFRSGAKFEGLLVVFSGFIKTALLNEAGEERVLGFPMKGDVLGADSLYGHVHQSDAVALSDVDVILVPMDDWTTLSRECPALEQTVYRILSNELAREYFMRAALGNLGAEARVARFLAVLAERFGRLGYSSRLFRLWMTRQDIGSYLGVTLETVSRALSALDAAGIAKVKQRSIEVLEADMLHSVTRLPGSSGRKAGRGVASAGRMVPGNAFGGPASNWFPASMATA